MPIGNNIDPATLAAAKMAKMPAADMGAATSADIAAMPLEVAPPTGPEADPMAGLDSALCGAIDQFTDEGAGAGAPDMGLSPDAGVEVPMDAPDAPEPDMPLPDVDSIV